MLTPEERRELLEVARSSISDEIRSRTASFTGEPARPGAKAPAGTSRLDQPGGAFVTLHKHGDLRGCIGYIEYPGPLRRAVNEVARKAAFEDPRFSPLTPDELRSVSIEISVLTPLRRIKGMDDVVVGRDGLLIELRGYRGLLLPQVATEYGWDAEEFLENTARKAGLPRTAWRDPAAELFAFSAEVFSEESEHA